MSYQRRLVYTPERVRFLFCRMRQELAELGARYIAETATLRRQVEEMRRELEGVRELYDQLRAVSLARSKAEIEVAELRRLREIGRAQAAQRDPAVPLH